MDTSETIPPAEITDHTQRLMDALRRYTEATGRYLYIDIYPIDPTFKDTNDYTHETTEVSVELKNGSL